MILQATPGTIGFAGAEFLVAIAAVAREKYRIPVVLHLDHGDTYDVVEQCLAAGFTSVTIDGSKLPYTENVVKTTRANYLCRVFRRYRML